MSWLLVWFSLSSLSIMGQGNRGYYNPRPSKLQRKLLKNPCNTTDNDTSRTTEQYYCYQRNNTKTLIVFERTYTIGGYSIPQWAGYVFYIDSSGLKQTHHWWGHVFAQTGSWSSSSYGWSGRAKKWKKWVKFTKVSDTLQLQLDTTSNPLSKPEPFGEYRDPECHGLTVCVWRPHATDPCNNMFLCPNLTNSAEPSQLPDVTSGPKSISQHIHQVSTHVSLEFGTANNPGIEFNEARDNSWYRALLEILSAGHVNESCYVCSLMPSTASESALIKPIPYSLNESLCILNGLGHRSAPAGNSANSRGEQDSYFQGWYKMNITATQCESFNHTPIRTTFTENQYRPVMTVPPQHIPKSFSLCFERKNNRADNIGVGESQHCNLTVTATCGSKWSISKCAVPGYGYRCNVSGHVVYCPSDDGGIMTTDGLYMCGNRLYSILPPHWQGRCGVIYLTPTIQLFSNLSYSTHHYPQYRPKREVTSYDNQHLMTSAGTKFLSGTLPWWGVVNNAHNIDKLHVRLENLTAIVSGGFAALTPWSAAVRTTLIQHQMALDLLLASQGGLCHIIGDLCCTYIPDISGNMTATVDHLNDLLASMKREDVFAGSGWDWWTWLSWDWRSKLLTLVTPVLAVIVLLCICTTCITPLIKKCISNLISINIQAALMQYSQLPLHDDAQDSADSTSDTSGDEAEDTV
ncbi:uncharacterized protein [Pagrus major]|uniref:uncharacterized protein n=1 Tax=Pagrus major TaxID=143350 RepID=UPI003CC85941